MKPLKASETDFWKRYQRALARKQYEVHMPLSAIAEFIAILMAQNQSKP